MIGEALVRVHRGAGVESEHRVAWATTDPDHGDSSTDTGVNVLGGFGLSAVPLNLCGQIKWTFLPDDTPFSFSFGVRF